MAGYYLIESGTVVPGQMVLTSYQEASQADELGQILRFGNDSYNYVRLYCIRMSAYDLTGVAGVADYSVLANSSYKQYQPTLYVPLSQLNSGAKTLLYFPARSAIPGQEWRLYKVTV